MDTFGKWVDADYVIGRILPTKHKKDGWRPSFHDPNELWHFAWPRRGRNRWEHPHATTMVGPSTPGESLPTHDYIGKQSPTVQLRRFDRKIAGIIIGEVTLHEGDIDEGGFDSFHGEYEPTYFVRYHTVPLYEVATTEGIFLVHPTDIRFH